MPLYEYKCTNCGGVSEFILKSGDAPMDGCKHCGEKRLERILYSKFAIGSNPSPKSCETSGTCMGPCGDDSCRLN